MSGFFAGRDARLLTEGGECPGIRVWHMDLEEPEFGHMACRIEDTLRFIYVCGGGMVCRMNQEEKELRAGEGLFLNRKSACRFTESRRGGCEFYFIELRPGFIADGERGFLWEKYVRPLAESAAFPGLKLEYGLFGQERLLECLRLLGETAKAKEPCYELELKSLTDKAWRGLYQEFCRISPGYKKAAQRETEKLLGMLNFLHAHYREKITLGEMAADSGVSSGDYCRFFKKHMNQTPFEYLQVYRIERSLPELLGRSGSITEVALRHGFTGSSYYAETFKKEMGCAPGDYRKWYLREADGRCPLQRKTSGQQASPAGRKRESMPAHLL